MNFSRCGISFCRVCFSFFCFCEHILEVRAFPFNHGVRVFVFEKSARLAICNPFAEYTEHQRCADDDGRSDACAGRAEGTFALFLQPFHSSKGWVRPKRGLTIFHAPKYSRVFVCTSVGESTFAELKFLEIAHWKRLVDRGGAVKICENDQEKIVTKLDPVNAVLQC